MTVIGLSISVLVAPAPAWEFSMDGAFTWKFEYRGQGGREGFFGPFGIDAGTEVNELVPRNSAPTVFNAGMQPAAVVGIADGAANNILPAGFFAPFNLWLGFHNAANDQNLRDSGSSFASGADGSWNTTYMTTNMQIRMNQAIRIRGRIDIGAWNTPEQSLSLAQLPHSEYLNSSSSGVQRSFSPLNVNTLWLTTELPWGIVTVGKRPSTWGTGLAWNGEESRTSESLALTVPYGPFRIQAAFYPARRGAYNYGGTVHRDNHDGASIWGLPIQPWYNTYLDKSSNRIWDITFPLVTYRSGPLDMGFQWNFVSRHSGGEGVLPAYYDFVAPYIFTAANKTSTFWTYLDYDEVSGGVYMIYNNGRYFFNSEVDWDLQTFRNRKKAFGGGGGPALGVWDAYVEHWRFAAETGTFCGPAKVSLLYAWLSGPDRRNGLQIDRTGLQTNFGLRSNPFANTGFFRPYSYLMVYTYGLGTHMNTDTTNGTAEDAKILAARVDYAVASNLNVYGSFFWADRSNVSGYGWGFMRPDTRYPYWGMVRWDDRNNDIRPWLPPNVLQGAPNIPDPNLGYEIGAGMDWKLLENFTINLSGSYWQPGKWFSYACVDKTLPNWDRPEGGANFGWGVWPDRTISPLWGLELKIVGDF
jgi:hypothetical protein